MSIFNSLEARVVEIWPGLNTIGRWQISKNLPYYINSLNFVIYNGKLYPIATQLTKKFVGQKLIIATLNHSVDKVKQLEEEVNNIAEEVKSYQKIVDPINLLKDIYCHFQKETNFIECFNNANTNLFIDDAINNLSMAIVAMIINYKKEGKKVIANELLSFVVKDESIKTLPHVVTLVELIKDNPLLNWIFSKAFDYLIDYGATYLEERNVKLAAKVLANQLMTKITLALDAINLTVDNVSNIYGIITINDKVKKMQVEDYILKFIEDYVYKYNMNIYLMSRDSILDKNNAKGYIFSNEKYYPRTFFQTFVMYGIKNHYLNNFDFIFNRNDIYNLWLGAHTALKLIEKYGDGGNLKIYLDVNNKNDDISVKINPASYTISSYYWMLPLDLKYTVNIAFDNIYNLNFNSKEYLFKRILYIDNYDLREYNPFYYKGYKGILIVDDKYIKINGFAHLDKIKIQNHFVNQGLKLNLTKTINYNGFVEPNYQFYNSQSVMVNDIFIVPCDLTKIKNILSKYCQLGVVDYNVNLNEKLYLPIDGIFLKNIFTRYIKINNIFSLRDVQDAYNSIQWTTPIRRKQFFKFLVKLLKLNINQYYSREYLSLLNDYCKYTTIEGCALKIKGISNGSNPNAVLTLFQVLLTLDKIENAYKRTLK